MRVLKLIGGLLILFASPAMAREGAAWVLTQKSGDVRVLRNGLQPASLQLRAALTPGDVIATGATGRAMLTNGDDYVVVAPASRLVLPKDQAQTGFTRLMQQVGTMLYKVRHTGVPHFAVETPLLAAVVKGTSFTIVVDKDRTAVQVTDGIVEVSSAGGAARRLVERGATVYVGRARPDAIVEVKAGETLPAQGRDVSAVKIGGSGDVPLSAVTSLTAGLLQPVIATPVRVVSVASVSTATPSLVPVRGATATAPSAVASTTAGIVQGVAAPTVAATTPAIAVSTSTTVPALSTPTVTATVSTPAVSIPVASVPAVTAAITVPAVSTPAVTAAISVPTASTPAVTAVVSVPPLSTPAVTAAISTPVVTATVSTPTISAPTVTASIAVPTTPVPAIPTPTIVASVATPTVTTPTIAVNTPVTPTITVPSVTLPGLNLKVGLR